MGGTWNRINRLIAAEKGNYDIVRRRLLKDLADYTKRDTIIYVADFLNPDRGKPLAGTSLGLADKTGFVEVLENLRGAALDVLIESPGGSAEAAESVVALLRSKYNDIRFIVPNVAKSAATMLALSGNSIVMDERSELGPTDPQMIFKREGTSFMAPAQAILDQFAKANVDITADSSLLPSWIPILNQYGPALLKECEDAITLAKSLVSSWLEKYMFAGEADAQAKAQRVAVSLSDHHMNLSHARMIGIDAVRQLGIVVVDMNTDPVLKSKVWDVYQAITLTFGSTGALKIFENHLGDALVNIAQPIAIGVPATPANPGQAPVRQSPPLTRQQRREAERQKRH